MEKIKEILELENEYCEFRKKVIRKIHNFIERNGEIKSGYVSLLLDMDDSSKTIIVSKNKVLSVVSKNYSDEEGFDYDYTEYIHYISGDGKRVLLITLGFKALLHLYEELIRKYTKKVKVIEYIGEEQ
jgi:hypothetical protein